MRRMRLMSVRILACTLSFSCQSIEVFRRTLLVAFRITMILSVLRIMEHGDLPQQIVCEERDFQTTLEKIKVLVKHASKVFAEVLEEKQLPKRKNQKGKVLRRFTERVQPAGIFKDSREHEHS